MKIFKKLTVLFFIALYSSLNASAQHPTQEIIEKFFSIYSKDPIKATEYAFSTNKWFEQNQESVDDLKSKLKEQIDQLGDYYGFEFLSQTKVGSSIRMINYIVKYDRQPIRFTFLFYNPNKKWQLNNFSFDDNIDEELSEALKLYRLKEIL